MDGSRFDDLTRRMASRRSLVRGGIASLAGSLAAGAGLSGVLAACRPGGNACQRDSDCCSGKCYEASKSGRNRVCCTAESNEVACQGKCGTITNSCGVTVQCPLCDGSPCRSSSQCANGSCSNGICCIPATDATTCSGKCGSVTNNCGAAVSCQCANGTCIDGVCCVPDSDATTCSGKCGIVNNNCGAPVTCLSCDGQYCQNSGQCANGTCTNNICCIPNSDAITCSGKCGLIQNNCLVNVACPVCDGGPCDVDSNCNSGFCGGGECCSQGTYCGDLCCDGGLSGHEACCGEGRCCECFKDGTTSGAGAPICCDASNICGDYPNDYCLLPDESCVDGFPVPDKLICAGGVVCSTLCCGWNGVGTGCCQGAGRCSGTGACVADGPICGSDSDCGSGELCAGVSVELPGQTGECCASGKTFHPSGSPVGYLVCCSNCVHIDVNQGCSGHVDCGSTFRGLNPRG